VGTLYSAPCVAACVAQSDHGLKSGDFAWPTCHPKMVARSGTSTVPVFSVTNCCMAARDVGTCGTSINSGDSKSLYLSFFLSFFSSFLSWVHSIEV
jgi:hypothetical protein